MNKIEAINHVISSAQYWSGDTIDNSYYTNNLGLERAFNMAIEHVKNSHKITLNNDDIKIARKRLGLK